MYRYSNYTVNLQLFTVILSEAKGHFSVILFPEQQHIFTVICCVIITVRQGRYQSVEDVPVNKGAGFGNNIFEVCGIDIAAYEQNFNMIAFHSVCEGAGKVNFFYTAQVFDHVIQQFINAQMLAHQALYIGEKRVFGVGGKEFAVAFGVGGKQPCLLEAVELDAYGIGRFAEFSFKTTKVSFGVAVQEELKQQLNTCF